LQPISQGHHSRTSSTVSDGFGDFIDSNHPQELDEDVTPVNAIDDDWQDADLVQSFSPVASAGIDPLPATSTLPPPAAASIGTSTALNALDWDAWETPRGPTPQPGAVSHADENFFDAFEKAAVSQQSRPSPPMIDLRQMEKKLDDEKKAKQGLQASDLDFFETFERSPSATMSTSRERAEDKARLHGSQLESMKEAQTSPMNILTPAGNKQTKVDYFGDNGDLMMNSPGGEGPTRIDGEVYSPSRSDSWSDAAGQWAGTFRKTLGNLRGQAAEFAQHLPSSKDFIVPEGEENEEGEGDKENGGHSENLEKARSPTRRIARASEHSQSTPFGTSSGSGGPASPPLQTLRRASPSRGGTMHGPIKGAPGFNPNTVHNWNTGSWSLSSTEESKRNKKSIPVQLKGRREESQDVISEDLAAQLTAHLPKRLQLGKTWKLLYSSDQHGISLGTLYWKVQSGLDNTSKGGRKSEIGVADAEGWLRGASQQTQEAVTGIRRVGGGLNLTDAGLILAVKDSDDNVFGSYVNERIRAQSSYYGNGEW